jgi:hypothetical protein
MNTTIYKSMLAVGCSVIAAVPVFAHHSFTMVDRDRAKLIEGTVVDWHFNSPHAWLYIEAPDAHGEMVRWGVEGGAPIHIIRQGVKGDSFQLGEQVRIVMSPLRDGRPAGGVCFVEKTDGEILMFNDGSCFAPAVLHQWRENGWLENGAHLDEYPVENRNAGPPN